jgi:hypothetical protein
VNPAEVVAIQQLYALYGHVMDDADWPRLRDVFTDDVVFDATALGVPLMEGVDGIVAVHESTNQAPLAHHVTNVLVERLAADGADVRAKVVGIYPGGRAFSGHYRDQLVRTPAGWRIRRRVNVPAEPRRD